MMFHHENVVCEMGMTWPTCFSMNDPGVAAVSGPEPE